MTDALTNEQRNGESPAYPGQPHDAQGAPCGAHEYGLTKRELFAAMAMQGWLAGCRNAYGEFTAPGNHMEPMINASLKAADALLAALERGES